MAFHIDYLTGKKIRTPRTKGGKKRKLLTKEQKAARRAQRKSSSLFDYGTGKKKSRPPPLPFKGVIQAANRDIAKVNFPASHKNRKKKLSFFGIF